jgi:Flp pilus assembly protein CpaB
LWIAIALAGAVACGSIFALDYVHHLGSNEPDVPIVVAASPISAGTVVTRDMLTQQTLPEHFANGSAIKPESINVLVGHKALVSLKQGSILTWNQFDVGPVNDAH